MKEAGTEGEGFSPGKCPMVKQCGPDRHPATACRKCSKGYSDQSDDNVLHQKFTAGTSGYVEDAGLIESESESDITKRLKLLLKNPPK